MSQLVDLAVEHIPSPRPGPEQADAARRVLFLHGILGSGANLRSIARRFVASHPRWDAWLVDLRGHGKSPKGTRNSSLEMAAADVRNLARHSLPIGAIIGHSFGGKVALLVLQQSRALTAPKDDATALASLTHVVTLDSNPGARPPVDEEGSALWVLKRLASLPETMASRTEFVKAAIAAGLSPPMAQWLAMSTEPTAEGRVRFALDREEMYALLSSYFATDLWPIVESPPNGVFIHVVIGEKSTSYTPADRARVRNIAAHNACVSVDVLATDHFVHTEDPNGVLSVLETRIL